MAKKSKQTTQLIVNRRARFDYELHEKLWAGIALTGPEVRAARSGRVSLRGAYVTSRDDELWLTNATFSLPSGTGTHELVTDTRSRKLLIKREERARFIAAKDQGMTIVPLSMTTATPFIKVEIASAMGKKLYDKRESIKKRDVEREQRRTFIRTTLT
jgi:SsrA-binding protein